MHENKKGIKSFLVCFDCGFRYKKFTGAVLFLFPQTFFLFLEKIRLCVWAILAHTFSYELMWQRAGRVFSVSQQELLIQYVRTSGSVCASAKWQRFHFH